jgi:hypothetical protein
MLIEVISVVDESAGLVDASFLEGLIKSGTITAFKRSNGWVRIDRDPIRQYVRTFSGPERRTVVQRTW